MKVSLSKKLLVSTVLTTLILGIGVGAYADSALKQVTAYQNSNLLVKVNGKQIDQSSEDGTMYPLVYDGHSYVSAKGLAEAMGGKVLNYVTKLPADFSIDANMNAMKPLAGHDETVYKLDSMHVSIKS
jgi:hypothetical protein